MTACSASYTIQVDAAIEMADVICFLCALDSRLSDIEHNIAEMWRGGGKPVVVAVNIRQTGRRPAQFYAYYELGFPEIFAISASHKLGLTELLDAVTAPWRR